MIRHRNSNPLGVLLVVVVLLVMHFSGFMNYRRGGDPYDSYSSSRSGGYNPTGNWRRGRNHSDNFLIALIGTVILLKTFSFLSDRMGASRAASGGAAGGSAGTAPGWKPAAAPRRNFLLPNGTIAPKAEATLAVMRGLAGTAPEFDPARLETVVADVFLKVEKAWEARDLSTVRPLMLPVLFETYSLRAQGFRSKRQINKLDGLKVLHIDFVHVRCPEQAEGRSFTALITASAADYLVDDLTNSRLGGDPEPATFQEFWTFYRLCDAWALSRIDKASDMVALNAPNLPSVPPRGAQAYAAPAAAQPGPAATAAAAAAPAEKKPVPSPAMDRQKMEIAATLAFESVYEAWGSNDPALLKPEFATAAALARLRAIMEERKAEGLSFKFGSFFTRRAEVVMGSRPAAGVTPEFTARITATALRAMLRNGRPLHTDASPQPFTEYWVFTRAGDDWKLSDILPRMDQEAADGQDGAPGPAQIEWYWGQGAA